MPLCTRAQGWSNRALPIAYQFFDEHMPGWQSFWESMKGDQDKILKWATDSGIEFPEDWYNCLHLFLFDHFSGDVSLLRQSAKARSFNSFLAQAVENHIKEPKDKWWYMDRGTLYKTYVAILERASDIVDPIGAVAYINARSPNLGDRLHNEFLLSLTGWKEDIKEIASALNRQAYELENEICTVSFETGEKIRHACHPNKPMVVVGIIDDVVLAEDEKTKSPSYIEDVWNIERR